MMVIIRKIWYKNEIFVSLCSSYNPPVVPVRHIEKTFLYVLSKIGVPDVVSVHICCW